MLSDTLDSLCPEQRQGRLGFAQKDYGILNKSSSYYRSRRACKEQPGVA
jgi:hypothetical protein